MEEVESEHSDGDGEGGGITGRFIAASESGGGVEAGALREGNPVASVANDTTLALSSRVARGRYGAKSPAEGASMCRMEVAVERASSSHE